MKIIVVYKSKYGSSQEYATWLGEELRCEVKQIEKTDQKELLSYDTIIYIGGLYAGGVAGFKKISKNLEALKDKRLLLCMVGMTNPAEQSKYKEVFDRNVPEQYRTLVKPFALRGNQLFSKMSLIHRIMMKMPKAMTEKIPVEKRTDEDKQFLESFGQDMCFVKRENLGEIIKYLNNQKS